jgi:hypothetical protein
MLVFFLLGGANDLKIDSICTCLNIQQLVKILTNRGNISLDVIFSSMNKFYSPPQALLPLGGSYYYCLLLSPSLSFLHLFTTTSRSYHSLNDSGLFSLDFWLSKEFWSNIYDPNNVDDKILTFHKKLNDNYMAHFPGKKLTKCSNDKPYINYHIRMLIQKKWNLFKRGK